MPSFIKLALGNLWEHKAKTLILGLLIMLGVMIIVLGNSFLESTKRNLERDFRAHYTGDILIHGPKPKKGTLSMFGVSDVVIIGMPEATPALPDTKKVLDIVKSVDETEKGLIKSETTIITNIALMTSESVPDDFIPDDSVTNDIPYFYSISGDPETYFKMFKEMKLTEGTFPDGKTPQILVDERSKVKFEKYYKLPLTINSKILVQPLYGGSTIREVSVCGFYKQPDEGTAMMALCYLDPSTARGLADLTYGSLLADEIPDAINVDLGDFSEENLFSSSELSIETEGFSTNTEVMSSEIFSDQELDSLLGDTSLRDKLNETDDAAWHFIQLKLKDPSRTENLIVQLNKAFTENNINVTAINWRNAAIDFASTTDALNGFFTVLIIILAIVVFIVIMNTLIVSIIERTPEIGTMRALGAGRKFIRRMFFTESFIISIVSSLAGVLLALIVAFIVNMCNIQIADESVRILLGGADIGFIPTFGSIVGVVLVIVAGSALANLYPVSVALKITPLKAMSQE